MSKASIPDYEYCVERVRSGATDLYLSTLLLNDLSYYFWVSYSFHIEFTDIVLMPAESDLREMRLRWWHDQIKSGSTEHPLLRVLPNDSDFRDLLYRKAECHITDLSPNFQNYSEFEDWSVTTRSSVYKCVLDRLLIPADFNPIIRSLGISWSTLWVLQTLGIFRQREHVFIPFDLLSLHGLDNSSFCSEWDERHISVIRSMLDYCEDHIILCENALDSTNVNKSKKAFIPLSLFRLYVLRLRKCIKTLDSDSVSIFQPLKQYYLYRALHSKRYK